MILVCLDEFSILNSVEHLKCIPNGTAQHHKTALAARGQSCLQTCRAGQICPSPAGDG